MLQDFSSTIYSQITAAVYDHSLPRGSSNNCLCLSSSRFQSKTAVCRKELPGSFPGEGEFFSLLYLIMSPIFQQYMRGMDDYHFISKCSENYLSDTRVTKIFLSVSAQWLRKKDKKITGPNGKTGKVYST